MKFTRKVNNYFVRLLTAKPQLNIEICVIIIILAPICNKSTTICPFWSQQQTAKINFVCVCVLQYPCGV